MTVKKIIGILTLAIILFGSFRLTTNGATEELLVASSGNSRIESDLIVLLLEIKSIDLRGDIFNEATFSNLKDFGIEIAPQPTGRDNPFANI